MKKGKGLYNHVGRPTNEEVKKVKNKKIVKGVSILLFVLIVFALSFIFLNNNFDFSTMMGNSASTSSTVNFSSKISSSPMLHIKTGTSKKKPNALQGAAGYDGYIYYSLTSSRNKEQHNYFSKVYYYNLKTKAIKENNEINEYLAKDPHLKNNDVVFNTSENRAYYLFYYNLKDYGDSSIILRRGAPNNGIYNIKTIENNSPKNFYNIGYSISYEKYVSVNKNYIYFYNLNKENDNITFDQTSSCKLDDSLKSSDIVMQGITVRGKLLYVSYQTTKNNGREVKDNHFNIYDMRNCFEGDKTAKLVKKYDLGYNDKKYELESLFFMDGKLYLGYNAKDFSNVYFYTANVDNSTTINLSLKNSNSLVANIKNSNGTLYYSFCNYPKVSKCRLTSFPKVSNKSQIKFNNYTMTKNKVKPGTYYLHTYDIFGKYDVSNPITVK